MKLSLTAAVLFLAVASSALPYNGAQISSTQIMRRQVPVDQPAMAVGGNIVPYTNPGGANKRAAKIKRAAEEIEQLHRRQVPVDQPSMAVGGNIVPYSNSGKA